MNGMGLWLVAALFLVGCASTPKIDWPSRVGNYSYDQAVLEFGPPDKTAELTDGTLIADWVSRSSAPVGMTLGFGTGNRGSGGGAAVSQTLTPAPLNQGLRLTFNKDRKLLYWSGHYP